LQTAAVIPTLPRGAAVPQMTKMPQANNNNNQQQKMPATSTTTDNRTSLALTEQLQKGEQQPTELCPLQTKPTTTTSAITTTHQ
jgi:hypothetical protein